MPIIQAAAADPCGGYCYDYQGRSNESAVGWLGSRPRPPFPLPCPRASMLIAIAGHSTPPNISAVADYLLWMAPSLLVFPVALRHDLR